MGTVLLFPSLCLRMSKGTETKGPSPFFLNDAVKIAAALASMKYSSRASVASKAQSEARRYFEYEIDL